MTAALDRLREFFVTAPGAAEQRAAAETRAPEAPTAEECATVLHRVRDLFVGPPAGGQPLVGEPGTTVACTHATVPAPGARPTSGPRTHTGRAGRARSAAGGRERTLPTAVAILCAPGDIAAAAAVGVVLAAHARGCAVVCRWTGAEPRSASDGAVALPAAAALARRFRGRDLAANAAGRLVVVDLPSEAGEACTVAGRVAAAAGDVPVVLAVAGPRPSDFDEPLATQDRVLVLPPSGAPEGMADLALLEASRTGRAAGRLSLTWGAGGRSLAARGLLLPRAIRAATLAALEGRDA